MPWLRAQAAAKPIVQTDTRCRASEKSCEVGLPKPHGAGFHMSFQFQPECQGHCPMLTNRDCPQPPKAPGPLSREAASNNQGQSVLTGNVFA